MEIREEITSHWLVMAQCITSHSNSLDGAALEGNIQGNDAFLIDRLFFIVLELSNPIRNATVLCTIFA